VAGFDSAGATAERVIFSGVVRAAGSPL